MHIVLGVAQTDLRLALGILLSEEPGVKIVGEASETKGLLALIKITQPDLVIFEWDLPPRSPDDVLAEIHSLKNPPRIIVLGNDRRDKQRALTLGADGFVVKGDPPEKIQAVFKRVRAKLDSNEIEGDS